MGMMGGMTEHSRVGTWLKSRADELGYSATDLSRLTGASYRTVTNTLKGRSRLRGGYARWEDVLRLRRGSLIDAYEYGTKPVPVDADEPDVTGSELRDETERALWAIPGLSEERRWNFIYIHRAALEEEKADRDRTRRRRTAG